MTKKESESLEVGDRVELIGQTQGTVKALNWMWVSIKWDDTPNASLVSRDGLKEIRRVNGN